MPHLTYGNLKWSDVVLQCPGCNAILKDAKYGSQMFGETWNRKNVPICLNTWHNQVIVKGTDSETISKLEAETPDFRSWNQLR